MAEKRFKYNQPVYVRKQYAGLEGFFFRHGYVAIFDIELTKKKQWIYHIMNEEGISAWVEESDLETPAVINYQLKETWNQQFWKRFCEPYGLL